MRKKNTEVQRNNAQHLVVQEIKLVSPDRNRKDAGKLKNAIELSESAFVPNRYKLLDLYHDVVTIDGHLSGLLDKRTKAVTNKRMVFMDKSGQKVDAMDDLIGSSKFERLLEVIMERKYYGTCAVEFIVGKAFDYNEIDRRHIRPESREIAISQFDARGISVDELPMVWLMGEPYELGKLLQCSLYALYKRSGFGDFAQYVEIFGQPVRVVKYDAYDEETRKKVRDMLEQAGSSLTMMIPKQADFEMLDGKTSNGTGELQERLINCCNQEMSVAILGNSETTTSSKSSGYAQAEIHADQQLEITISDMRYVCNMLNSPFFMGVLAGYGYPVEGGKFVFEQEQDLGKLQARLTIDLQLASRVPIDDDYFYETYGLPKPQNYEQLKREQEERRQAALDAVKNADREPSKEETKEKSKLYDRLADFFGFAPL